jgi:hypothetical protein
VSQLISPRIRPGIDLLRNALNDRILEMRMSIKVATREQSILDMVEAKEEYLVRKMERKLATERGRHLQKLKEYDIHMTK